MLHTENLLEAIHPYLAKDKKLWKSDFNRLFSTLTRKEQYEKLMLMKNRRSFRVQFRR